MKKLVLLFAILSIGQMGLAETATPTPTPATTQTTKPTKSTGKPNNSVQSRSSVKNLTGTQVTEESPWSVSLSYMASTDLNDQTAPRAYSHTLSADLAYLVAPSHIVWLGTAFAFTSLSRGNEVIVDEDTKENFISDVDLGYTYSNALNKNMRLKASAGNSFPVSPFSQAEGYKSISSASVSLVTTLAPWFRLIPSLHAGYIWNTYEFSPNSFDLNRDANADAGLSALFLLKYGFSFRLGIGARAAHYLDGTTDIGNSNSVSLAYDYEALSLMLSYVNGTYADQQEIDLFFVDRYRQLTRLMVGYEF